MSLQVLVAAQRYNISSIINVAKSRWGGYLSKDPMSAYFAATRLGWDGEALQAARATMDHIISDTYVDEMENVTADLYQQLLNYHYRCCAAARAAACRYLFWDESQWDRQVTAISNNPFSSTQSILLPVAKYHQFRGAYDKIVARNKHVKEDVERAISEVRMPRLLTNSP